MGAILCELNLILADCRSAARDQKPRPDQIRILAEAAGKIEASIYLLEGGRTLIDQQPGPDDLENPRREIPSCSVADCEIAAGAVVGGELYCAGHASEALERRMPRGQEGE
jgi:hypothetical protein